MSHQIERIVMRAAKIDVPTVLVHPAAPPRSAVVIGMPAMGISSFTLRVASELAELGRLVIVPDYYHGEGPADPDLLNGPDSLDELVVLMANLDFRQACEDMLAGVRLAHDTDGIDQVSVWGYCTGATIAALAGCLGRDAVAKTVLFYPSQMVFEQLTALRPQSPMDLLWVNKSDILLLIGDSDWCWPPATVEAFHQQMKQWELTYECVVYPAAGHVFADHWGDSYRPEADADSWRRATEFIA